MGHPPSAVFLGKSEWPSVNEEALVPGGRNRGETPALQGSGVRAHLPVFPFGSVPRVCSGLWRFLSPTPCFASQSFWILEFQHHMMHTIRLSCFSFALCACFVAPGRLEVLFVLQSRNPG